MSSCKSNGNLIHDLCHHRKDALLAKFRRLDGDQTGKVELNEARTLTKQVFPELPDVHPYVTKWFLEVDGNHSGELDFGELMAFYTLLCGRLVASIFFKMPAFQCN